MKIAIAYAGPDTLALRRLLAATPGLEFYWSSAQGRETAGLCLEYPPDLLLMGLSLADMDCAQATRLILSTQPCPILLICADPQADYPRVYEALALGAMDAASLPGLGAAGGALDGGDLLNRIDTLGTLCGHEPPSRRRRPVPPAAAKAEPKPPPMIAIGASTGGPKALATLLEGLPADFPAAIVIVQHLDPPLAAGLATLLDRHSPLPVAALSQRTRPQAGRVWLAAGAEHVVLDERFHLDFSAEPQGLACRPSVDVFFHSLARHAEARGCGVLLTGMGRDGAAGLLALRGAGFYTIAQDEASSVVFGMPKAALELDGACAVLPLAEIAGRLVERMGTPMAGPARPAL